MSRLKITSPYDNTLIKEIDLSSKNDVDKALNLARDAFDNRDKWLTKNKRVSILKKCVSIMNSQVDRLVEIAVKEGGKPLVDSQVEIARAINSVEIAIEHMSSFKGTEIAMGHTQSSANRMAYTIKEPIGVVASISAFNHPLNLAVHQTVPAIATGSPVIIKPSILTPLSAINFVEILYEAGLPKQWCQVIVCDNDVAEYLATSPKIVYLSFIGSSTVGWYLNSKVAKGTRVGLEHGGVAPVIVDKTADIDELIPALTKGAFYHAGQVCVSVQKVYIDESIIDDVSSRLVESASKLVVGDPLDAKTQVGSLISQQELQRVESWVNEAIESGAKALIGGTKISDSLFSPTILLNPPEDAKVSTLEIFGPVVSLYSYNNLDEAIKLANSLDVSFQSAIFSKDIDTALYCAKRLDATAVMVNDHTAFRVDWMPFGGAKTSGLGLGGIPYSMEEMSKEKLMVIKSMAL
jgi:acyl-CoA reductase-like NAD-dependent aldehyde dehydrogenase